MTSLSASYTPRLPNKKNTNVQRATKEISLVTSLFLYGLIPVLFGLLQISAITFNNQEMGNVVGTADYYHAMPIPIVMHIICGSLFCILGPFQFSPTIRMKFSRFHKLSGRLIVITGIIAGISGLWMNQYYPAFGGGLKYIGIAGACIYLLVALYFAVAQVVKGNITAHKRWMIRATAAILTTSTQRVLLIPVFLVFGEGWMTPVVIDALIVTGVVLNMIIAEWIITALKPAKHA